MISSSTYLRALIILITVSPIFAQTTAVAMSFPAAPTAGDMVTIDITLTGSGPSTPSGSLSYTLDGNAAATAPLDANGTATLSVGQLSLGSHALSYTFPGDSHYAANAWSYSFQVSDTLFTFLGSSRMILYNTGDEEHAAVDSRDNVYFSDQSLNVIHRRDIFGNVTTVPTIGLNSPQGIAFDAADNLYIADSGNSRVVRVTPAGVQTTLPIATGSPFNLTFDNARQNLYITDLPAQEILVFNLATSATTVYASNLYNIFDVAFDPSGTLYYSQRSSYSNGTLTRVSGGVSTLVQTPLNSPGGIAFDRTGNLYMTDFGSGATWMMTALGHFQQLTEIGSAAIALDSRGVIYLPSGPNSYAYSTQSAASTGQSIAFPGGGGSDVAQLTPTVYYSSSSTESLSSLAFPATSSPFRTYAGVTCLGIRLCYESFANNFVHPGPQAGYVVATSSLGTQLTNLVFGNGINSELAFSPGVVSQRAASGTAFGSFFVFPNGDIFGTAPGLNKIYESTVDSQGHSAVTVEGAVQAPTQIAGDAQRNVYLLESGTSRILRGRADSDPTASPTVLFDLSTQTTLHTLTTFALDSAANLWIGAADINGNGVVLLQDVLGNSRVFAAGIPVPAAMVVDGFGTLYSADAGGALRTFDYDGRPTVLATGLVSPRSIAAEPSGAIYVANGTGDLVEVRPDGSQATVPIVGVTSAAFVTIDNTGSLAVGDNATTNIFLVDRSHPQGYAFGDVPVNTISPVFHSQLLNVGNQSLSFSGFPGDTTFVPVSTAATCTTTTVLAPGGVCEQDYTFNPTAVQPYAETGYISDGTGGASSASSLFAELFSGTGIVSTPPVVTVPGTISAEAASANGTVVTFTASAADVVDGTDPVTCLPASGSTFPIGTTTVACTAIDRAGSTASKGFNVVVRDTTAPALTVPGNITVAATGANGAVVTFTASATDAVDGARTVTCNPASGALFAIGGTTVSCSATDLSGNTATGTFSVTVTQTTSPITLRTSIAGLGVSVDGGAIQASPFTITLTSGSHTISVAGTQAGGAGIQYVFTGWSDAGTASHSIAVGTAAATYTATFKTQYLLTTVASPAAGGSITTSQYFDAGSAVPITAAANAGFVFAAFSGAVTGSANPQTFTMGAPATVAANFTAQAPNLAAAVGTRTDVVAGVSRQVVLNLSNSGLGSATHATITSVSATVALGAGVVSIAAGVPVSIGTIASGATGATAVLFNWPASATKVKLIVTFTADNGYTGTSSITTLR